MLATDMDKILRAGGQTDRIVETLKGADATRVETGSGAQSRLRRRRSRRMLSC